MDFNELAAQFNENIQSLIKCKPQKKMTEFMYGGVFILQYLLKRGNTVLPSEISNEMNISTARIAAALNNLENKGLINREINKDDRRQIFVTLTPKGKKIAEIQQIEHLEMISRLLRELGEHDANEIVRITGKMLQYFNKFCTVK